MVFPLFHAKGQVIASGFWTTHGYWLALMQGVWWYMSMAEELPESQHGSCTIIFQQGFDVKKFLEWFSLSEVYSLWWSMIVVIDNGNERWNSYNQDGDCWVWLSSFLNK